MRPPITGAVLCAIAAVALLVAGFTPWFSSGKEMESSSDRLERLRSEAKRVYDEDYMPETETDIRANFGLVTGEVCIDLECKSAKYTGAPELSDDAFAWLGRGTLGAAMASVVLLVSVALAARTQRRTILRGWAATVAATAAALGAAFASAWTLDSAAGYVSRGMGLTALVAGAALAGLGVGWPAARGYGAAAKRYGLAAALVVMASLAWATMVEHAWWHSGKALDELRVSPLGVQVCEEGSSCKLATALGVTTSLRSLAALAALATSALLVPAFGTAGRIARGVRPGAWGWATAIVGVCALGAGVATWLVYPGSDVMRMAWGVPAFAIATVGATAVSIAGVMLVKEQDVEVPALQGAPLHAHGHALAHGVPEPAFAAVAPGERPVLPALAPAAGSGATAAIALGANDASKPNPISKYAPSAEVAAAAVEAATGRTYVPAFAQAADENGQRATGNGQRAFEDTAAAAAAAAAAGTGTAAAAGAAAATATGGLAARIDAALASEDADDVVEPVTINVVDAGSAPNNVATAHEPSAAITVPVRPSPLSPSPSPSPAPSPYAPIATPEARGLRPEASPAAAHAAVPAPVRAAPTQPTAQVRKASPMCPTCRVATLWSSKRGAWWCSTCKQTL